MRYGGAAVVVVAVTTPGHFIVAAAARINYIGGSFCPSLAAGRFHDFVVAAAPLELAAASGTRRMVCGESGAPAKGAATMRIVSPSRL
jgi:hypothetical protein